MNKCEAAKQKAAEADESLRELGKHSLLTAVEPVWKRRWLELSEVHFAYLSSTPIPTMTAAAGRKPREHTRTPSSKRCQNTGGLE